MRKLEKIPTFKQVRLEVGGLLNTILLSKRKALIKSAFKKLNCIVTGACMCDLVCKEWEQDIFPGFELGRQLVTSHAMQWIKERFRNTPQWDEYVGALYADLFESLYADIHPSTFNIAGMENEWDVQSFQPILEKSFFKEVQNEIIRARRSRAKKRENQYKAYVS